MREIIYRIESDAFVIFSKTKYRNHKEAQAYGSRALLRMETKGYDMSRKVRTIDVKGNEDGVREPLLYKTI